MGYQMAARQWSYVMAVLACVCATAPTTLAAKISAPGLNVKAAEKGQQAELTDPVRCDLVLDDKINTGDAAEL